MDKIRIAVASTDGIVVNSHFGKAEKFYIYEAGEENINLVELREMKAVCISGDHNDSSLSENLKKLSDCNYLLVSRIGEIAENVAESMGIKAFEIPGIIEDSIEQIVKFVKIQKLFE